ncbi:MAG: DUF3047 domain-containing protein [Burkholderiales bacterium]
MTDSADTTGLRVPQAACWNTGAFACLDQQAAHARSVGSLDLARSSFPRRRLLGILPAVVVAGCASPPELRETHRSASVEPEQRRQRSQEQPGPTAHGSGAGVMIPPFSRAQPGGALPQGWEEWLLHRTKRKTQYSLVRHEGRTVLRARAEQSASGLVAPLGIELDPGTKLQWAWRIADLIAEADNSVAETEDAPVRVVLSFDGPWERLPVRERLFAERVRLIAGRELPYATLMYIWANRHPIGQVIENPHTQRIRKLVVDSGDDQLKRWRSHERLIYQDFEKVFGERPGRLTKIGILTDTDNTRSTAEALYSDLVITP